ncbi:MAG TPA: nucleotide exchange factor GrpE [Candidatus Limisoma intestinavium]|uniref:Protein GrpE n=1 Tax=Candidatus Limisoma intestinavium TaxID=2840856 RepID=A0A9D1LEV5_9BACT|nr:nucleotide exchange factor GrpE [Candidatus Limisoma intestinavium]
MSEKSKNEDNELKNKKANAEEATAETAQEQSDAPEKEEMTDEEKLQNELETTKESLEKEKKEYMFLLAEFDNFRKRTLKEKAELIKNAGENAMKELLPVVDDFERAMQAAEESSDIDSIKEGIILIYNKFMKYLEKNGVTPINSTDADFNTEFHEAVTTFPTDDESKKGKVIDTVQKGYMMHDKVLRHSKVVVGQ